MRYRVAKASEYLVISGCGVKDLKLSKKGWILPGQSCTVFDVTPVNYTFEVQAMSAEKLPFILPAVFTIGPKVEDEAALLKYARLISPHDKLSHHVKELVQGVIEGETRVLAASMTMEEIFRGTKQFKKEVFEKVQLELDQFGLLIYNANVKQLVDVVGHEYFSYLGQKTQMEAANQAKIDVAEAKMKGDTGAKEREGLTLQNAAKVDAETRIYAKQQAGFGRQQELKVEAETKIFENEREAEVSEANTVLATKKAMWVQQAQIADIEAAKNAAIREAELQREVERRNALTETERIRAKILTKATVEYETKVQESNAEFYQKQKETDAVLYEKQNEAEAKKLAADAAFYTKQKEAEAQLYAKKREAEGLMAMAEAHAYHVKTLLEAFRGNYMAFRDYMMLDKNVYQDMAKFNAEAIKGLNPKVSVWTTGSGQAAEGIEGSNGAMQQISGIYKMIPPLFTTVKEQTGMSPPSWVAKLAPEEESSPHRGSQGQ